MQYTSKEKLPVIELQTEEDKMISFDRLAKIIMNRPANTVYFEYEGKLRGIISMGDIRRAAKTGKRIVQVNEHFTYTFANEYMRARYIFYQNENIRELPVVDQDGGLIGEYARWDDLLYESQFFSEKERWKGHVALVRPCGLFQKKKKLYQFVCERFLSKEVIIDEIDPDQIKDYVSDVDWIVLIDKGETSAFETLYVYMQPCIPWGWQFRSFKEHFNTKKERIELFETYIRRIEKKGVFVLSLKTQDNEYTQRQKKRLEDKFTIEVQYKNNGRLPVEMGKDFFDDLYTEDYAANIRGIMDMMAVDVGSVCGKLKDCRSQYYNVENGERKTFFQPEDYTRTIYMIGPCYIVGAYSEDKNTIESFLQKRLNDSHYEVKVVNCGSISYGDFNMLLAGIMDIPLRKGDILVIGNTVLGNVQEIRMPMVNMAEVLEKHCVPDKWLLDMPEHCNHKVNALYADAVFEALRPIFSENVQGQGEYIEQVNDMVKEIYIDQYFSGYHVSGYEKVGAIVMNCNPFTYGHRYLIEQAIKETDFLIIFVVEEDKSVFSFAERFAMVKEGVADLEHIMVVPSGPFILSQTTFPEYFIKAADEDLVKNAEDDIRIFAEKIAPYLNINYRFVGEEPEDMVTREYNEAMKRILPKYGIKLVEIPRKEQKGRYISASAVRKCLEENDREQLKELVPETTIDILFLQNE